jgi:hypothetical protein
MIFSECPCGVFVRGRKKQVKLRGSSDVTHPIRQPSNQIAHSDCFCLHWREYYLATLAVLIIPSALLILIVTVIIIFGDLLSECF